MPKYTLPCLDYLSCDFFKGAVICSDNDIRQAVKKGCVNCADSVVVDTLNVEKIDKHILKLVNDALDNIGGSNNG